MRKIEIQNGTYSFQLILTYRQRLSLAYQSRKLTKKSKDIGKKLTSQHVI